jgi:CRP-like cAMP-binding protein
MSLNNGLRKTNGAGITHPARRRNFMTRKDFQIALQGERTNAAGKPVSNKLLLSIPESEYNAIRPHLEFLSLSHHRSLYEPNCRLEFVHFPNSGMVSLVIETEDGRTVEVGEVGKEGIAGIPAAVGMKKSQVREIVQIEGNGFRMRAGDLQSLSTSTPQFQLMLTRYAVLQGLQIAQTAACNRLHNVEQRLARWLLITQDRVDSANFAITQDFLATMLGTDRPTVSVTAGILQKKRIIVLTRGVVQILSRAKLQSCACECYEAIQLDRFGEGPLRQGKTFVTRSRRPGR